MGIDPRDRNAKLDGATEPKSWKPQPREGVTLFIAGQTPGWGELEFRLNDKAVEGVRLVDTQNWTAQVYARDADGNWPVFTPAGKPLLYELRGKWTVHEIYPPDIEFEDPEYVARKKETAQKRRAAKHGAEA